MKNGKILGYILLLPLGGVILSMLYYVYQESPIMLLGATIIASTTWGVILIEENNGRE